MRKHVIADDMIIAGTGKDDEEHDKRLKEVMTRAIERNVKFNPEKVQFKVLNGIRNLKRWDVP